MAADARTPPRSASRDAVAPPPASPAPDGVPMLPWTAWMGTAQNALPLSGDVSQWIRAWGEAVGQVGLFNVNIAGAGDPQLEKRIGAIYSYGRQLGRVLDVLTPLVKANEALLREQAGDPAVDDFHDMVRRIARLKRRDVDEIVEQVRGWRDDGAFEPRLAELLERLQALSARAPR